jgi:hypothetical protein
VGFGDKAKCFQITIPFDCSSEVVGVSGVFCLEALTPWGRVPGVTLGLLIGGSEAIQTPAGLAQPGSILSRVSLDEVKG